MKEIEGDPNAFELETYEEYVEKAKRIKGRDPKFIIRPNTGKTYIWARNITADLWCLLDKGTYYTLVETGEWSKGVYQMWTNKREVNGRSDNKSRTSTLQLRKLKEDLRRALETKQDYESLSTAITQIVGKIETPTAVPVIQGRAKSLPDEYWRGKECVTQ